MTEDQIRRLLDTMKHDIERLFHRDILQVNNTLERIEREVKTTNGRVTRLEEKGLVAEAVARDRAQRAQDAAELVAEKAQAAIESKERSRRWWLGVIAAVGTGVGVIATAASLLADYLK
jgi:cell division septum initiation protein DivIVA